MKDKLYRLKKFEWLPDGDGDYSLPSSCPPYKDWSVREIPGGGATLYQWHAGAQQYRTSSYKSVEAAKAAAEKMEFGKIRFMLEEVKENDLRCIVETDDDEVLGSARIGFREEAEELFVGVAKEISDFSEETIVAKRDADGALGIYGVADVHILPVEFIS